MGGKISSNFYVIILGGDGLIEAACNQCKVIKGDDNPADIKRELENLRFV